MKYSKKVLEAKEVFEENVCDYTVPWDAALNSFHNYMDILRSEYSLCDNPQKDMYTSFEIDRCAMLLKQKHLNPKSLGTSFALWKNNHRS